MTSHGAAILLPGARFTSDGTVLLDATPRPDVGPLERSTGAGISSSRRGSTATAEAGYQIVQAIDLHVRTVDGGWSRQSRLGDSHVDLGGAERSEAGSRAALLAVEAGVSISEALSLRAASEAIGRVDAVNWNSRRRQLLLLRAQVVVLDALVREAEATPGTAIGCSQTIFAIFGTGFLRDADPTVPGPSEPIIRLDGGWNECGSNAGTRRHRNAFVGKTQAATGTALGMGQTIFSVRRALSIALGLAEPDQRCHREQQDQLLHSENLRESCKTTFDLLSLTLFVQHALFLWCNRFLRQKPPK